MYWEGVGGGWREASHLAGKNHQTSGAMGHGYVLKVACKYSSSAYNGIHVQDMIHLSVRFMYGEGRYFIVDRPLLRYTSLPGQQVPQTRIREYAATITIHPIGMCSGCNNDKSPIVYTCHTREQCAIQSLLFSPIALST